MVDGTGRPEGGRSRQSSKIPELEALRALLALWVVASHVAPLVGIPRSGVGVPLHLLNMGGLAVDGFVILSGFVITLTLARRPQPWLPFMVRRYFRLMPALLVAMALAVGVSALTEGGDQALPEYAAVHILLHLAMLHGVVPDTLLPNASHSLLDVAWSISLEWQFYLVAPALVAFLQLPKLRLRALCLVAVGTTVAAWAIYAVVHFGGSPTFLPLRLTYFLLGMLCAAAYQAYPKPTGDAAALAIGAVVLVLLAFSRQALAIPFALWLGAFALAWIPGGGAVEQIRRGLALAPIQWLGAVSYSLYIVHQPLLNLFAWLGQGHRVSAWVVQAAAVAASLAAAWALHNFIEKPGIAIGQRLASALSPRSAGGPLPERA